MLLVYIVYFYEVSRSSERAMLKERESLCAAPHHIYTRAVIADSDATSVSISPPFGFALPQKLSDDDDDAMGDAVRARPCITL